MLLGCCEGALQRCLRTLARWAFRHKAVSHVSQKKTVTVAMVTPSSENQCVLPSCSHLVLPGQGRSPDRAPEVLLLHKWLGIPWPADLDFNSVLVTRVALAKKSFALLVGLAQRDILPIHIVNSIFWAKVFPVLALGCWLYALADSAGTILNQLHESWPGSSLEHIPGKMLLSLCLSWDGTTLASIWL